MAVKRTREEPLRPQHKSLLSMSAVLVLFATCLNLTLLVLLWLWH